MATEDIRDAIRTKLLSIAGLGGPGADADRHVHKYGFEVDDEQEAKQYWQSLDGNEPVVNATMLTRIGLDDREPVAGREFAKVHTFRLIFKFGKTLDPLAEKRFEVFLDAIHAAIRADKSIFVQDGQHPQPEANQGLRTLITNEKLFGMRVWKAEIEFDVVEWTLTDTFTP